MATPKGYKIYGVSAPIGASVHAYVYATDPEHAKEQATEHFYAGLCHQCARNVELGDDPDFDGPTADVHEVESVGRWSEIANEDAIRDELKEGDDG